MADKKYFWTGKGVFGKSVKFGDEMPKLDNDRRDHLLKEGKISDVQPVSFDAAKANKLAALEKQILELSAKNEDLERSNARLKKEADAAKDLKNDSGELKKLAEQNEDLRAELADLQAQLEDAPKTVKESRDKIKELKQQIEDLTNPGA